MWIRDLKLKPEILKVLEKGIGNTLQYIRLGKDFLNRILFALEISPTIDKQVLINVKKICIVKETINSVKNRPKKCKEILATYIDERGLIVRIYKELVRINETNDPIKNWTSDLNREFSIE